MYNGIGLTTPRGSGTSGYVVKNLSQLKATPKSLTSTYSYEVSSAPEAHRKTSEEVLKHFSKRKIEIKVIAYQDELEETSKHSVSEIEDLVVRYRQQLLEEYERHEKRAD